MGCAGHNIWVLWGLWLAVWGWRVDGGWDRLAPFHGPYPPQLPGGPLCGGHGVFPDVGIGMLAFELFGRPFYAVGAARNEKRI